MDGRGTALPPLDPTGWSPAIDRARAVAGPEAIRLHADARTPPRVVLIEPHPLVRVGLGGVARAAGFEVVDVASPSEAAGMGHVRADVVVLAVDASDGRGEDALGFVLAAMPQARAVVLVDDPDDPRVLDALKAGACGAILKEVATDEIVPAIRAAADGESVLSAAIASRLVRRLRRRERPAPSGSYDLTQRELDVLTLMSRGWDNPRIAAALYVGRGTVKHHIATIFDKLGVDNRVQAAVEAVQVGLLDG